MEAEIGRAATSQGVRPPEVGRVKERSCPRAWWALPCRYLDFRLWAPRTVREDVSVVLGHPVCPGKPIYPAESNSPRELIYFLFWFGSCHILAFCLPAPLTCVDSLEAVTVRCSENSLSFGATLIRVWVLVVPLYGLCGFGQDISSF